MDIAVGSGEKNFHKYTKLIRSGDPVNEPIDLAGYDASQATQLIISAFDQPISLRSQDMIRVSFMVGGGKKLRMRYDNDLPKVISKALGSIGYIEDKGSSASLDCQGTWKFQHDLDKDLKTIHVFPRVQVVTTPAVSDMSDDSSSSLTHEQACLVASFPLFQSLIIKKVLTFNGKKKLLSILNVAKGRVEMIETNMMNMLPISDDDTAFFNSVTDIQGKIQWLTKILEDNLCSGLLSKKEKDSVVAQMSSKIEKVRVEMAALSIEEVNNKKRSKLLESLSVMQKRLDDVKQAPPIRYVSAQDVKEVLTLRQELARLNSLEKSKQLLSNSDLQLLLGRPHIENRLAQLEVPHYWFDDSYVDDAIVVPDKSTKSCHVSNNSSARMGPSDGFVTLKAKPMGAKATASKKPGKESNRFSSLNDDD